jgi:hypothetical protein
MKTAVELALEAEIISGFDTVHPTVERFHTLTRNATLDEIADKIGKMPFGDTAASFAVWIREQKT